MLAAGPLVELYTEPEAATPVSLSQKTQSQKETPLVGTKILLVEDGKDNQRLINHHLTKAGAEVTIVENGKLAVESLTADGGITGPLLDPPPFDLVVTDMQMPEMDGYTEVRLLRHLSCTLPIIALTAHAMKEDVEKCLNAGCDYYASKPIEKTKLIDLCAQAIRQQGDERQTTVRQSVA